MPEQMKTKSILELPAPCKRADAARDLLVAYVSNSCSPAERLDFEVHCAVCDECLTTLAIIEDLLRSPVSEGEEKELARSAAGREAAAIARRSWRTESPTSDSCGQLRKAA
jgi:anti-sigma factor RsiW